MWPEDQRAPLVPVNDVPSLGQDYDGGYLRVLPVVYPVVLPELTAGAESILAPRSEGAADDTLPPCPLRFVGGDLRVRSQNGSAASPVSFAGGFVSRCFASR